MMVMMVIIMVVVMMMTVCNDKIELIDGRGIVLIVRDDLDMKDTLRALGRSSRKRHRYRIKREPVRQGLTIRQHRTVAQRIVGIEIGKYTGRDDILESAAFPYALVRNRVLDSWPVVQPVDGESQRFWNNRCSGLAIKADRIDR